MPWNVAFLLVNWKIFETWDSPRGRKVRVYLEDKYLERGQIRMDLSFPNKNRIWGSGSCGNNRRPTSNIPSYLHVHFTSLNTVWTPQEIKYMHICIQLLSWTCFNLNILRDKYLIINLKLIILNHGQAVLGGKSETKTQSSQNKDCLWICLRYVLFIATVWNTFSQLFMTPSHGCFVDKL